MNSPSPGEDVLFAALEKGTAQERAAYLDKACQGDLEEQGRTANERGDTCIALTDPDTRSRG